MQDISICYILAVNNKKHMKQGNKKYNFEDLVNPGDSITVKPANIYSLKNSLRRYSKENDIDYKKSFEFSDEKAGNVLITRK